MKATGEVMAIGRTFEAALQKAVRSLEIGAYDLRWESPAWSDPAGGWSALRDAIERPNDLRLWASLGAAPRRRRRGDAAPSGHRSLVPAQALARHRRAWSASWPHAGAAATARRRWRLAGRSALGFSRPARSRSLSAASCRDEAEIRALREAARNPPGLQDGRHLRRRVRGGDPVLLLDLRGGGRSARAARPEGGSSSAPARSASARGSSSTTARSRRRRRCDAAGYESIMINNNPETVSTDFDTSDRLYFEPLDGCGTCCARTDRARERRHGTAASIRRAVRRADGDQPGRAAPRRRACRSSAPRCESDRHRRGPATFEAFLRELGIPQPPGAAVTLGRRGGGGRRADRLPGAGAPLLRARRPGDGDRPEPRRTCARYMHHAVEVSAGAPILVDKYLQGKEVEVDVICDGETCLIPGIMEHIERAGVHCGDSFAVYPGRRPLRTSDRADRRLHHPHRPRRSACAA